MSDHGARGAVLRSCSAAPHVAQPITNRGPLQLRSTGPPDLARRESKVGGCPCECRFVILVPLVVLGYECVPVSVSRGLNVPQVHVAVVVSRLCCAVFGGRPGARRHETRSSALLLYQMPHASGCEQQLRTRIKSVCEGETGTLIMKHLSSRGASFHFRSSS